MTAPRPLDERHKPGHVARGAGALRHAVTGSVARVRAEVPGILGAVLAGIQGGLFSLALVLIPVWVIAASASGAQVSWSDSTGVAARIWLMGFAVPWSVDGVPVTLIPLGVAALTGLMLVELARRFGAPTWTATAAATAAFAGTVGLTTSLAWSGAPDLSGRVTRAVLVAVALGAPSVAWGLARQRGVAMAWLDRVPDALRSGVRLSLSMVAATVMLASLTLVVSTLGSWRAVARYATELGVDTAGGLALAFLETLYAPTLVVWTVSWLSGAGYVLGDVIASSGQSATPAIPALPLLGTLTHGSAGPLSLSPFLIVTIGALVTVALRARIARGIKALPTVGFALALTAVAMGLAARASRGAMGPGTLASVGPQPVLAALLPTLELGIGALVGVILLEAARMLSRGSTTAARSRSAAAPSREMPVRTSGRPEA